MYKNYSQNSLISFVALLFILFFVGIPLVIAVICCIFGSPVEIISNVIDLIPFGEATLSLAAKIISSITGQTFSYQTTHGILSFSYVLGELSKSIFTVIVFVLLDLLVGIAMGLGKKPDGKWNRLKKAFVTVFEALIAACLAPVLINFAFDQVASLVASGNTGKMVGNLIACIMYSVVAAGGTYFAMVVLGYSLGQSILYIFVNIILLGFFRIFFSYLFLMLILVAWQMGLYSFVLTNSGFFFVIIILLAAIEQVITMALE